MNKLPAGYRPLFHLDLQQNKRQALIVNGLALGIGAALIIPALLRIPFIASFREHGLWKAAATVIGAAIYAVLHELTHGAAMKCFSREPARFGFTGLYAYAGSGAYFEKVPYLTIALAPLVVWGLALWVLNSCLTRDWFWPVYLIQAVNLSGGAGDLYVTFRMARLPRTALVRDSGTTMTVYGRKTENESENL